MSTFLLTWNPRKSVAGELETIARLQAGEEVNERWSLSTRRTGIEVGDRAFMVRQKVDRGIVAAGRFTSEIYIDEHWDDPTKESPYADVRWDVWLDEADRLATEALLLGVPGIPWNGLRSSGVQVDPDDEVILLDLWTKHVESLGNGMPIDPMEIAEPLSAWEGAKTTVFVNRYERSRSARTACIARWGTACAVCGFEFKSRYGELGDGYIHVHHLTELSSLGAKTQVDPERDLRPVCANCHSMLHRRVPALTIQELRRKLR